MTESLRELRKTLYDGRFRLVEEIGAGGSGTVWRAFDVDTDAFVAVKRVFVYSTNHRLRLRREIAALRMLQIPGVVALVEVGEVDHEPYIAMELIPGSHFPGHVDEGDWRTVVRRGLALCLTLERVHTLGVVHRDLKPANVMVQPDGRVVLLDFGLARGEPLAETVTEHGGVVGTVGYLAPEQMRGKVPDFRADLYALGMILHQSLGGQRSGNEMAAFRAMMRGDSVVIPRTPITGVPEALDQLVGELMEQEPDRRPGSTREVAERLSLVLGEVLPPPVPVPFVGREGEVSAALAALRAHKPFWVWAARGGGKTRFVEEVAARLEAEGAEVVRLAVGERPFDGLLPLVAPLPTGTGGLALAAERLTARLAAGLHLVVDDLDRHDPWTRRIVERCAPLGAVLMVANRPEAQVLPKLSAVALRPLFAGPDAFLHLIEDGAALLYLRTLGVPARVARELRTWLAVGRAEWDISGPAPKLEQTRTQLDELEGWPALAVHGLGGAVNLPLEAPLAEVMAWSVLAGPILPELLHVAMEISDWELDLEVSELEERGHMVRRGDGCIEAKVVPVYVDGLSESRLADMHRRLATVRVDDPEARMRHHLACGDVEAAVKAAAEAAERQFERSRLGRAKGLYAAGIRAARGANRVDIEDAVLVGYVETALSEITASGADEARRYAERRADALAERLERLAKCVGDAAQGRWTQAEASATSLGAFEREVLESARLGVLVRCANLGRTRPVGALIDELEARLPPTRVWRTRTLSWRGLAAYAAGDFETAVRCHEEAEQVATTQLRKLLAVANLCVALLECFEVARMRRLAVELEATSRECRLHFFERWAFGLILCADYRLRQPLALPDAETLRGSFLVGHDLAHSNLCLTIAAEEWRRGNLAVGRGFAERAAQAARAVNRPAAVSLPLALAAACGGDAPVPLHPDAPPRVRAQTVALLASAGVVEPEVLVAAMATPAPSTPFRLEVLAWSEVTAYLSAPNGTSP